MNDVKAMQAYALAHPLERADGPIDGTNLRALPGGWQVKISANY